MTVLLIIDTCALLDFVRAPARMNFHPGYAAGSRKLLAALQSAQPPARVVIPDVVQTEYQRHVDDVTAETTRLLTKTRDDYRQALEVIGEWSQAPIGPHVNDAWIEAGVRQARQMAEDFRAVAAIEPTTQDDNTGAIRRVITGGAPSRRGKDSTADCIILESALRLARGAPAANLTKVVFFSSNTVEYCDARLLKPALQAEFDASGLEYVRNWGEAARAVFGVGG